MSLKLTRRGFMAGVLGSLAARVLPRVPASAPVVAARAPSAFRQLKPMPPMEELAKSIRWTQVLYGVPLVYAPARKVIFMDDLHSDYASYEVT